MDNRKQRRQLKQKPNKAQVVRAFQPLEEILRDLKSDKYDRTERGTPVIVNDEGSFVFTVVALDGWKYYCEWLVKATKSNIDLSPFDRFIYKLKGGMEYIKKEDYEEVRKTIRELKALYAKTPSEISEEAYIDTKATANIKGYMGYFDEVFPEALSEVRDGSNQ